MDTKSDATTDDGAVGTDSLVYVEDASHLDEIVDANDVVLADFYADWCGPCKMLEPIVADLAVETQATIAKVDVDELPALAHEHRVQGIPTMVLFSEGEIAERIVGLRDKDSLAGLIERHAPA